MAGGLWGRVGAGLADLWDRMSVCAGGRREAMPDFEGLPRIYRPPKKKLSHISEGRESAFTRTTMRGRQPLNEDSVAEHNDSQEDPSRFYGPQSQSLPSSTPDQIGTQIDAEWRSGGRSSRTPRLSSTPNLSGSAIDSRQRSSAEELAMRDSAEASTKRSSLDTSAKDGSADGSARRSSAEESMRRSSSGEFFRRFSAEEARRRSSEEMRRRSRDSRRRSGDEPDAPRRSTEAIRQSIESSRTSLSYHEESVKSGVSYVPDLPSPEELAQRRRRRSTDMLGGLNADRQRIWEGRNVLSSVNEGPPASVADVFARADHGLGRLESYLEEQGRRAPLDAHRRHMAHKDREPNALMPPTSLDFE